MRFFPIVTCVLLAACGGQNPIQPPPPPPEFQLSCPVSLTREAISPQGADVHWDAPTPAGGREPYNIQCEPGSGSVFAIGESSVQCSATDADMRRASCAFGVSIKTSARLARTRFVAFGDSITVGEVPEGLFFTIREPLESYPYKLEQMLRTRYPAQEIVVVNRGWGGEEPDEGVLRLPGVLDADQPEVLLLQEGTNGLTTTRVSSYANHLRTIVATARQRHVDVILANLLPVGPPHTNTRPTKAAAVRELNRRMDLLAVELGIAPVLDLYAAFEADPSLLAVDGLHPTRQGYTRIAELFADEIIRRYGTSGQTSLRSTSCCATQRRSARFP